MKVQDILDALSTSEIVQELVVLVLVKEPAKQALRAKVSLKGGYVMYITEAFGKGFRSYSYHIQKDGKMVRRWDNAPHWPEMKTFPHHFHLHSEKEALECREFFAIDVLLEIRDLIKSEGC
jgi:predicted RNase H-like nuclease (RuvC/YqgF family)